MLHFATYYHIYNHANGDDNLFREEKNYDFFLKKYHQHIDPIVNTVAWCLMKNHFHLLVRIKEMDKLERLDLPGFQNLAGLNEQTVSNLLSKRFSNLFNSYTKAFNKVYKRRGSLFVKNFKKKEIDTEKYLANAIVYIHMNPVGHGFTNSLDDWRYSSFISFPDEQPELLKYFFGEKEAYFHFHQERINNLIEYNKMENYLIN